MATRICIPEAEYQARVKKAAALVAQRGLDVLVVHSTAADYANVRYFSDFWPLFETAGVAISPSGQAALMVGPATFRPRRVSSRSRARGMASKSAASPSSRCENWNRPCRKMPCARA